jgi:hypothetical protein
MVCRTIEKGKNGSSKMTVRLNRGKFKNAKRKLVLSHQATKNLMVSCELGPRLEYSPLEEGLSFLFLLNLVKKVTILETIVSIWLLNRHT